MTVTVVEAGPRGSDPHHGLAQHCARVSHRLRERAPQVKREITVTVVGEAFLQAAFALRHRRSSQTSLLSHRIRVFCGSLLISIKLSPTRAAMTARQRGQNPFKSVAWPRGPVGATYHDV